MVDGLAIDELSARAPVDSGPVPEPAPTRALYLGLFCVSAGTLLLELTLTRIFNVVLFDNLAYLIVSSAVFGYSLAAVCMMVSRLRRAPSGALLTVAAMSLVAAVLLLFPAIRFIPADLNDLPAHPLRQIIAFGALYVCVLLPFFAAGMVVSTIVTRKARHIHRLYFWDLSGAAVGCLGIFVLPGALGGEETLFVGAVLGAVAAACFSPPRSGRRWIMMAGALGLLVVASGLRDRIEFPSLVSKRGVHLGRGAETTEFSRWDPVSKIDVLRTDKPFARRVVYDGGSQSSMFLAFDGDYAALQRNYFELAQGIPRYSSGKYLALSHWLKRDRAPVTLVIGSAGGQETLAALAWGASHVDAVEMVCAVVEAAKGPFAAFIGHIFDDPRVDLRCDEGRSFLERATRRYDVIQMHSAHTTSSIANGAGGTMPVYLQTVEAYREYFRHLSADGILQINYFAYLRMLTTAAQAWHELFPNEDFRRHVVITSGYGPMPTFLVKRSTWSAEEIASIRGFLGDAIPDVRPYRLIYAPGAPEERNIPQEFFRTPLDRALVAALPYKILPPTDDQPFFRDLRKHIEWLEPDAKGYVTEDIVAYLNRSLRRFVPMEFVHLYFLGCLSILVAGVMILVPLVWRRHDLARRETPAALLYFMCLGAGFILIELTLMSKLLVLVGFPVYAMATVLFTLLLSAGVGSYLSSGLSGVAGRAAALVIGLFAVAIIGLVVAFPWLRDATLRLGVFPRAIVAGALVIPFGVPLGMPFPLGIAALEKRAPELIPWAWAANGFMTVVGSVLAPLVSIKLGFDATLAVGGGIYVVALASYLSLTRDRPAVRQASASVPEPRTEEAQALHPDHPWSDTPGRAREPLIGGLNLENLERAGDILDVNHPERR